MENRWCYWLDYKQPCPTDPTRFRVCIVVENEPGKYEMGNPDKGQAPWFWTKEEVSRANSERHIRPLDSAKIVVSSMRQSRRIR